MVWKFKTEDFEEAVVTRPLHFKLDLEMVNKLRLFGDPLGDPLGEESADLLPAPKTAIER